MSQRDLLWFLAGATTACAIVGAILWSVLSSSPRADADVQASLPSWHPPTHVLAEQMRRERNYEAARAAYAELEKQGAMPAHAWADYADVVASLQNGALGGEPARLIEEALKADPDHPKALWLQASLAHQQARYGEALELWRRLHERLPANSPDQRIISANIEEATRLGTGARPASALDLRLGLSVR